MYRVFLMTIYGKRSYETWHRSQADAYDAAARLARGNVEPDRPVYMNEVHDEGPADKGPVVIVESPEWRFHNLPQGCDYDPDDAETVTRNINGEG